MSDLIKREDAIRICKMFASAKYRVPYIEQAFENIPTIDAVSVVRCAECKHNVGLTNGFWEEDIVCDYWESDGLTADDFCSYGERKESE